MNLVSAAQRGIQNTTWDTIYSFRQKKLPAPSMDSGFILQGLIKNGRMPCKHATNFGQHRHSGFMDLKATDAGIDIYLTARLRKGCDLKHSLALLGEMIQTYSEKHRHKADEKALELALFDAQFMALGPGSHHSGAGQVVAAASCRRTICVLTTGVDWKILYLPNKNREMRKDHIISEIRRTAEKNNGSPLGKIRFFKETGIKESDWRGKYWSKWNDAVLEAGFAPNEKQGAFSKEHLLEKYAEFVIELGRLPTSAETRIKARNTTDFPSHNTFRRLGSKKELVGHVIEFCKEHPSLQQAYGVLKDLPHVLPSEQPTEVDDPALPQEGYVYLLQFGKEYKIGTSNNVERRFRELKTQMPYEGKIIHTIRTGDPEGIEAYWHSYFSDKRLRGEWFKLTPNDIKYFKKRKLM